MSNADLGFISTCAVASLYRYFKRKKKKTIINHTQQKTLLNARFKDITGGRYKKPNNLECFFFINAGTITSFFIYMYIKKRNLGMFKSSTCFFLIRI